jgi:3-hydroxymyristoyl/3-hydroxydecanoyl-(acyl carrier protein) dehydratase
MSVQQAKYRHAVKPPENCHIHVELLSKVENVFRFRAVVETKAPLEKDAKKSNIVAKIRFTLANLPMEFITSSPENTKASIPKI